MMYAKSAFGLFVNEKLKILLFEFVTAINKLYANKNSYSVLQIVENGNNTLKLILQLFFFVAYLNLKLTYLLAAKNYQ